MSKNAKNASVRGTELELGERNILTSTDLVIFAEEPQYREQKKKRIFSIEIRQAPVVSVHTL